MYEVVQTQTFKQGLIVSKNVHSNNDEETMRRRTSSKLTEAQTAIVDQHQSVIQGDKTQSRRSMAVG